MRSHEIGNLTSSKSGVRFPPGFGGLGKNALLTALTFQPLFRHVRQSRIFQAVSADQITEPNPSEKGQGPKRSSRGG